MATAIIQCGLGLAFIVIGGVFCHRKQYLGMIFYGGIGLLTISRFLKWTAEILKGM